MVVVAMVRGVVVVAIGGDGGVPVVVWWWWWWSDDLESLFHVIHLRHHLLQQR